WLGADAAPAGTYLTCIITLLTSYSECVGSLQVVSSLMRNFENFTPAVLQALGQLAVGLSVSDIENKISGEDLKASLPALGKVRGWNADQSSAIINKLLSSGYQISSGQSLAKLGSLVAGLNSSTLRSLSPEVILEAIRLPEFVRQIVALPSPLKRILVEKISSSVDNPADLVKFTPSALTTYIPKSLLIFEDEKLNIEDLNSKVWTQEQAAMFFRDVIKAEPDFNRLSPSVLQGFTCAVASEMESERVQELAKVMKRKNVKLGEDQLSCLVKMVTLRGIPKDLDSYPKDLLLFLSPSDYAATGSCKQYFTNVGKANLDLLQRESSERKQLLLEALECLKIPGTQVSKENAKILGHLVCDLGEEYIRSSAGNLLKELSQCESFLPDQGEAVRRVLSSGNTTFGPPQVWSTSTLNELTGLFPVLNHSIWQNIPKNVLSLWLKDFARDSPLSRAQLATIVEELFPSRQKRDVAIPTVFPQTYPDGYPDSLLPRLGRLASLITAEDISKWKITSADMLATLLEQDLSNEQAAAVISRYVALGNPLNATALNAINTKYLCVLNATLLNMIDPNSLKLTSLNPSACPQLTKDILYVKAKRAFSDQHYLRSYYSLIEPYLGGAPGEDLRALSKNNVNMNVDTLVHLRRDALMSLTPAEVKGLLGINLQDLANWRNRSPIQEWARSQKQKELDKLGVGLTGGTQEGYMNVVTPKFQRM
ncbi:hypothetical protein ASZ78_002213, partial [Callipepla squamata]